MALQFFTWDGVPGGNKTTTRKHAPCNLIHMSRYGVPASYRKVQGLDAKSLLLALAIVAALVVMGGLVS